MLPASTTNIAPATTNKATYIITLFVSPASGVSDGPAGTSEELSLLTSDVAKILNVTSALISAYEKCERKPSIDKLVQLADIYHTTTDYILGRTNSTTDKILIDVSHLNDKQIQILHELIDNMN